MTPAERALAWHHSEQALMCDRIEPWEHGTLLRASKYPDYWEYNLVRVAGDPGLSADELAAVADGWLGDMRHRRIDFDDAAAGDRVRPELKRRGWRSMRLLWMLHGGEPVEGPVADVAEVGYDEVLHLREAWHQEDFPGQDPGGYHEQARAVALLHDVRVLAVIEDGAPIGYAQIEHLGGSAEIEQVYVTREHRGGGHGTQLTRAAIKAAGEAEDLWIAADDEDRPKQLYARLGFRPAATMLELQRRL